MNLVVLRHGRSTSSALNGSRRRVVPVGLQVCLGLRLAWSEDSIVRQKSHQMCLRAGKITSGITSTRSIYFCDVLYDGVLGQSVYGGWY